MTSFSVIEIIGANSFIGSCLIKEIIESDTNSKIRLLIHKKTEYPKSNNIYTIKGDLLDPESLKEFILPGSTVINLAYIRNGSKKENIQAVKNLVEVCAEKRIRRLIYCSTAVVVGRVSDSVINEKQKCRPISKYEITRFEIEKILLKESRDIYETVIVRPTVVFGPEGKNLIKVSKDYITGNPIINYFRACIFKNRKMNLVSVKNVASAHKYLTYVKRNINKEIYIISDDESELNNYNYFRRILMNSFGKKEYCIPVISIPSIIIKVLLWIVGKSNINQCRIYDCHKLGALGFRKSVSFSEELDKYVEWYKAITLSRK